MFSLKTWKKVLKRIDLSETARKFTLFRESLAWKKLAHVVQNGKNRQIKSAPKLIFLRLRQIKSKAKNAWPNYRKY